MIRLVDVLQDGPVRTPQHISITGSIMKITVRVDNNIGHIISHAILPYIIHNKKLPAESRVNKNIT